LPSTLPVAAVSQQLALWHAPVISTLLLLFFTPSAAAANPQGVRYTHRSNFLHSFIVTQPDALCIGAGNSMLMVVPMFHANSWGVNFAGARSRACTDSVVVF
jgi:hypothetical protein